VLVAVDSTSFALAVLAFRALLRATIETRSATRWNGPVVTSQKGCLGGMDGMLDYHLYSIFSRTP
jgi:hypothetical protein